MALGFQRWVGWPNADGLIHVSAFTASAPSELTDAIRSRDGRAAVRLLADVVAADPRLGESLAAVGEQFDYVYDYGHGAVRIGRITDDGVVVPD